MSRILVAWEFGAGLGHTLRLFPLVKELQARGHEVALCLRDFWRCASRLNDYPFPLLQSPLYQANVSGLPDPPLNYSEILHRFGYLDPDGLHSLVRGWMGIYQIFKPDLVIGEAAPTALLAANIGKYHAAAIGSGFFLPPATSPLPNMRPWISVPAARLKNSDAAALATVNYVMHQFGAEPLAQMADIFAVPQFFLTYPELDHYSRDKPAVYLGDLQSEGGEEPQWPESKGKKVFVYLYAGYRFNAEILQLLARLPLSAIVYAGALGKIPAVEPASNITYVRAPLDIAKVSSHCDFAICHGGHGLVCDMLRAGKPLLLLPGHLEEFLVSANVSKLGAGIMLNHEDAKVDLSGALQRLMEDATLGNAAQLFAKKYQPLTNVVVRKRLADKFELLINPTQNH